MLSGNGHQFLEKWLKDSVLAVFANTRECSPSLANFFRGEKKILTSMKQRKGPSQTLSTPIHRTWHEPLHMNLLMNPSQRILITTARTKFVMFLKDKMMELGDFVKETFKRRHDSYF